MFAGTVFSPAARRTKGRRGWTGKIGVKAIESDKEIKKTSEKLRLLLLYGALTLYTVLSVYPLLWMTFNSFKNNEEIFSVNPFGLPAQLRFENYIKAWFEYDVVRYFRNSVLVAIATVFFTVCLALMFAYATARMNWKLSGAARTYDYEIGRASCRERV